MYRVSISSSICGSGCCYLGKYRNSATNVKWKKKKSVTVLILELGGCVNGRMIFIERNDIRTLITGSFSFYAEEDELVY